MSAGLCRERVCICLCCTSQLIQLSLKLVWCLSACVLVQGDGVRAVSPDEGAAFAREHGCLYKETSAKNDQGGTDEGVYDALVWGEWGCVHLLLSEKGVG